MERDALIATIKAELLRQCDEGAGLPYACEQTLGDNEICLDGDFSLGALADAILAMEKPK